MKRAILSNNFPAKTTASPWQLLYKCSSSICEARTEREQVATNLLVVDNCLRTSPLSAATHAKLVAFKFYHLLTLTYRELGQLADD